MSTNASRNHRNQRNNPYVLDDLAARLHGTAAGVAWRWRTELAILTLTTAALWRLTLLITLTWAGVALGPTITGLAASPGPPCKATSAIRAAQIWPHGNDRDLGYRFVMLPGNRFASRQPTAGTPVMHEVTTRVLVRPASSRLPARPPDLGVQARVGLRQSAQPAPIAAWRVARRRTARLLRATAIHGRDAQVSA